MTKRTQKNRCDYSVEFLPGEYITCTMVAGHQGEHGQPKSEPTEIQGTELEKDFMKLAESLGMKFIDVTPEDK